jgi:hypothetical protein
VSVSSQPTAVCPNEPGSGGIAPQAKAPLISGTLQGTSSVLFYVSSHGENPSVTLRTTHLCSGTMAFDLWITTVFDPTCRGHLAAAGLVWDWAHTHPQLAALYDASKSTVFEWPRTNNAGQPVAAGSYYVCLNTMGQRTLRGGVAARLKLQ